MEPVPYTEQIVFDVRDAELLAQRMIDWNSIQGPRVGDFVRMLDGTLRRFTYHWGDSIQTTCKSEYGDTYHASGSFYFWKGGAMDFSGGLDHAIPVNKLRLTDETIDGRAWFFHHDCTGAHRGVHFTIPCRVWEQTTEVKP